MTSTAVPPVTACFTIAKLNSCGWKFDFSASAGLLLGSLRAQSGAIAALDARTVVFRLTGDSGERIRFTFELSPH